MAASHVFLRAIEGEIRGSDHTLSRVRAHPFTCVRPKHTHAQTAQQMFASTTWSLSLPPCLSPRSLIVVAVEAVLSHRAAVVCCRSRFSRSHSSAAHSHHLVPLEKHLSKVSNSASQLASLHRHAGWSSRWYKCVFFFCCCNHCVTHFPFLSFGCVLV